MNKSYIPAWISIWNPPDFQFHRNPQCRTSVALERHTVSYINCYRSLSHPLPMCSILCQAVWAPHQVLGYTKQYSEVILAHEEGLFDCGRFSGQRNQTSLYGWNKGEWIKPELQTINSLWPRVPFCWKHFQKGDHVKSQNSICHCLR